MSTRWDAQQDDLLQDWVQQDQADLQARNEKVKGLDAQRDKGLEKAQFEHDARLRELSPESELYPAQKELADKTYEQEKKGVQETHAKETGRVSQEYEQKHDASSRARESLQVRMEHEHAEAAPQAARGDDEARGDDRRSALERKLDADFGAPPVPPPPEQKDDKSEAETLAAGKPDDDVKKR